MYIKYIFFCNLTEIVFKFTILHVIFTSDLQRHVVPPTHAQERRRGRIEEVSFFSLTKDSKMPSDYDKDAYPEPPRQTPIVDKQTTLPNPALILTKLFYYSVDLPVTTFRGELAS